MKKTGIIVLALLIAVAGVATAKTLKQDLLPQAPAGDPDAKAYGQVVTNYAAGDDKTIVQVNAGGLTPGETYLVGIYLVGTLDTVVAGPNGKIQAHGVVDGDVSDDEFDSGVERVDSRSRSSVNGFVRVLRTN